MFFVPRQLCFRSAPVVFRDLLCSMPVALKNWFCVISILICTCFCGFWEVFFAEGDLSHNNGQFSGSKHQDGGPPRSSALTKKLMQLMYLSHSDIILQSLSIKCIGRGGTWYGDWGSMERIFVLYTNPQLTPDLWSMSWYYSGGDAAYVSCTPMRSQITCWR